MDTGRISLDRPLVTWLERFTGRPGVDIVRLTAFAASRAYQLHHLEHRDPADRLLIATAIELDCPLITYDDRIARFGESHGTQYRLRGAGVRSGGRRAPGESLAG